MKFGYIITAFCFISKVGLAQELKPFQFIQFFKMYQLDNTVNLSAATETLRGFDKHWYFENRLTINGTNEDMHFWLFNKEDIQEPKHRLSGSISRSNGSHYVEYEFDETKLFKQFTKQIEDMNPEDGGVSRAQGAYGKIYSVGAFTFVLREFPPGLKGDKTVYTIALTESSH